MPRAVYELVAGARIFRFSAGYDVHVDEEVSAADLVEVYLGEAVC